MQTVTFVSAALLALGATVNAKPLCARGGCKDACASVVAHTSLGLPDCSSFLLTTVTPAASTSTATSTLTYSYPTYVAYTTVTQSVDPTTTLYTPATRQTPTGTYYHVTGAAAPSGQQKRDAGTSRDPYQTTPVTDSPTLIPTYATSACPTGAAYRTACTCAGVASSTTTVTAPTTTTTTTVITSTTYTTTGTIIFTMTPTSTVTQAAGTGLPCDPAQDRNSGNPKVYCGQALAAAGPLVLSTTGGTEFDCLVSCDKTQYCFAGIYNWQNLTCNGYRFRGEMGNVPSPDTDIVVVHDF